MATQNIRAAVIGELNAPWKIEDVELESPRPDEILVKMTGTGICHTDIACRHGFPVPMPIVLGHEGAGIVESVGADIKHIKAGDHVVLSFDSCGSCKNCQRDEPAYCYEFFPRNFSGGRASDESSPISLNGKQLHSVFFSQSSFATYAIARETNAVVIEKDLPLEIMGPLGCGIQTGAGAAVLSLGVGEGDSFAIFGGGAVGLSALLAAKAVDAGTVIVVEPKVERHELAYEFGADLIINPIETPDVLAAIKNYCGGVDYAFDTTGIPAVIEVAMETLLPGGMLGMVGAPPPEASMPANLMSMLGRGVGAKYIIEGDSDPKSFIPQMIEWYQAGKFPFDKMIETFPFDQINEAAEAAESGRVIKPVLVF
ncbi:MAG: NAD(P)-dependent alcohol dehydrogenase [Porticoccaceae bacterium]|nr:NAD(P)-dependent alcohol dehydrogenase [Pseudomonadales bacterium]